MILPHPGEKTFTFHFGKRFDRPHRHSCLKKASILSFLAYITCSASEEHINPPSKSYKLCDTLQVIEKINEHNPANRATYATYLKPACIILTDSDKVVYKDATL